MEILVIRQDNNFARVLMVDRIVVLSYYLMLDINLFF